MRKIFKMAGVLTLAAVTTVSLASCKGTTSDAKHIIIGVQQTSGNNYESMIKFLDSLKSDLGFDYETVLLDSRNNDANLSTYQTKMLAGADGIITMVDMDEANTTKLLADCEKNNVYYAGYMTDFANVIKNDTIMNNKYMLGAVSDGDDGETRAQFLFDEIVKTTNRKLIFTRFPLYAYPVAATTINKFKELATAYNANHDDDFSYYEGEGTENGYEIGFQTAVVPDAEVQKWAAADVDAVVAVNSLGKRLLQPVKTNGGDMVIYQLGWDDSIISEFGDNGKIKTLCQTQNETILFPLVRILNAARGKAYSDEPTSKTAKIITGRYTYLSSSKDLADGRQNSMNFSTDHSATRALISPADAKALLAENNGTYAKLTSTINSWTSEYVLRRKTA